MFVAFREDEVGNRLAEGGLAGIKKRLRDYPDSQWCVAYYNFKPSVPNIKQVIEDITNLEAEELLYFKVTESGQVRKIDAPEDDEEEEEEEEADDEEEDE
jgi:hypothetical protein